MSTIIQQARTFFSQNGRPIDRARFELHFAGGTPEAFLGALAPYQNTDGGFGNGLEPDIDAPGSQPFATELALDYCLRGGIPNTHPLVQRTVAYLEAAQEEDGCWRFTPDIYAQHMAPWFQGWTWPNLNPSGPIAGLLREYRLGSERLHARVAALFSQWANLLDVAEGEFYSISAYAMYYLPAGDLPQREFYLSGLMWWLIRQHFSTDLADNGHWFEYIRSPRTWVGQHLPEQILNERLDKLAAEQLPDGGWPTPYSPVWRGPTTVNNLLVLRAFGRI